jgi:hypothetical protein
MKGQSKFKDIEKKFLFFFYLECFQLIMSPKIIFEFFFLTIINLKFTLI